MRIKQALACVLAGLMVLSSPISALALDNVNGTGQGETHQPSTPEIVGSFWKVHANQGWRITCINSTGNAVSTSLDIVHYFPEQVGSIFGKSGENTAMLWNNYYNNAGLHRGAKKTKIKYLGGAKTDPWFTWSICEIGANAPNGGLTNNGLLCNKRVNGDYTSKLDDSDNVQLTEARMITYEMLLYCINEVAKRNGATLKVTGEKIQATYQGPNGETRTINAFLDDPLHEGQTSKGEAQLTGTGKMFRDQLMSPVNNQDGTENTLLTFVLNCKIPDCDGRGNKKSDTWVPMLDYLDPDLQVQYEDLVAEGNEDAFTKVFDNNNLRLLIEPIHWSYTYLVNPNDPDGHKRGAFFDASYGSDEIIYGTVTQAYKQTIMDYQKAKGAELGILGYDWNSLCQYVRANALGIDWAWGLHDEAAMLSADDPELGLYAYDPATQDGLATFLENYNSLGYGCMITGLTEQPSGTPTWDSEKYPSDNYKPAPSPDTSDTKKYPKETSYNTNNNKANIVKFYVRKQGDKEIPVSNFTRENTLHTININDEPGYKVVDYFTSSTYKKPESQSTTYEQTKSSIPNGSLKGTSSGSVVLTPESNENTLYIKLISNVRVVKVYETGGHVDKIVSDTNPDITNNTLHITTPDNGYEYTENVQSPTDKTPTSWDDIPSGTPSSDVDVPLKDDTTTIYIHYNKETNNTGLVLHENEISHQFTLNQTVGYLVDGIRKYASVSGIPSCTYTWWHSSDDCDGHTCGVTLSHDSTDDYSFSLINEPSYNTQLVWRWLQTDQKDWSGSLSPSGGDKHATPNMDMILQRSISDKATLYPKLNSEESTLKEMGLQSSSYTPAGQRNGGADQPKRKTWSETFTTNFKFRNVNTPVSYYSHHDDDWSFSHTSSDNEGELNSTYSQPDNTTVYGVWGKTNTGTTSAKSNPANTDHWEYSGLKFNGLKTYTAEATMSFYPYYRMKYVTELGGAEKDAYLTSENLSKLLSVSKVDMSLFRNKAGLGLNLTSTQWSMHTKAQKLLQDNSETDMNSLLPAGAIFNLSTSSTDSSVPDCWVGTRIFQTYIPDKAVLVDATGILNKSEAEAKITAFKQQMDKVLDNYEVVMMGIEGMEANPTNFDKKSIQITGKEGKYQLGQKFTRDKKYDLQTGSTGADRSDLDCQTAHCGR